MDAYLLHYPDHDVLWIDDSSGQPCDLNRETSKHEVRDWCVENGFLINLNMETRTSTILFHSAHEEVLFKLKWF